MKHSIYAFQQHSNITLSPSQAVHIQMNFSRVTCKLHILDAIKTDKYYIYICSHNIVLGTIQMNFSKVTCKLHILDAIKTDKYYIYICSHNIVLGTIYL